MKKLTRSVTNAKGKWTVKRRSAAKTTDEGCLHNSTRRDLNRILASSIIGAVQEADKSPHDEDAEMEHWRMVNEGMEFWVLTAKARKLETDFFKKMVVYKKEPRDVAKKMVSKAITTKWLDTNKGKRVQAKLSPTKGSISCRRLSRWRS